jgi:hypothetical protein
VQKNKKYTEQDVFVPWHLQKKFVKGQEGAAVQEEPKKPKKKKKTRKQRAKEELERKQREERGESVDGGDENSQHASEDKPKQQQQQPAEVEESTPTDNRQAGDSAQVFHRYLSPFLPLMCGPRHQPNPPDALSPALIVRRCPARFGVRRYYHLFVEGELERIVQSAGGLRIVEAAYDHENWYVCAARE